MVWLAELSHKGILRIQGEDRKTFLQGLVTQDLSLVTPERVGYSLLLNAKGRYRYQFFLMDNPVDQSIDLLLDTNLIPDLINFLIPYRLRSKVSLENVSHLYSTLVFAQDTQETLPTVWPKEPGITLTFQDNGLEGTLFRDPRCEALGWQAILKKIEEREDPLQIVQDLESILKTPLQKKDSSCYQAFRLSLGIPEHQDLMFEKSIPLECGFEELEAIAWYKGCYLGQEPVARAHYQGTIRKRLIT